MDEIIRMPQVRRRCRSSSTRCASDRRRQAGRLAERARPRRRQAGLRCRPGSSVAIPKRQSGASAGHGDLRPAADGARRRDATPPEPGVRARARWASATSRSWPAGARAGRRLTAGRVIDLPLAADWPNRPRRIVDREHGRPSQTRWRVLAHDRAGGTPGWNSNRSPGARTSCACTCRRIGHPILGDALYAPPDVAARAPRLLLHASELRLAHPADGSAMQFSSCAPF